MLKARDWEPKRVLSSAITSVSTQTGALGDRWPGDLCAPHAGEGHTTHTCSDERGSREHADETAGQETNSPVCTVKKTRKTLMRCKSEHPSFVKTEGTSASTRVREACRSAPPPPHHPAGRRQRLAPPTALRSPPRSSRPVRPRSLWPPRPAFQKRLLASARSGRPLAGRDATRSTEPIRSSILLS